MRVSSRFRRRFSIGNPAFNHVLTALIIDDVVPHRDLHLLTVVAVGLGGILFFQLFASLIRAPIHPKFAMSPPVVPMQPTRALQQQIDKGNIIVHLGRAEGIVPVREQIPREKYRQGDRIRAYILEVQANVKGPQIVLSRAHPELLWRLFELEVPEIFERCRRLIAERRERMAASRSDYFKISIVGYTNAGKSTLFNALTQATIAAENYPFCTIDPNVGVVPLPDRRLDVLADIVRPQNVLPTTMQFVDIAGTSGTVKDVNLFFTELATPDNIQIIVPNAQAWGAIITNFSSHDTRRIDLVFGIDYGDSADKAMEIIHKIAAAEDRVLEEPEPWVRVTSLGSSSVDITLRAWATTADFWDTKFALTKAIKEAFDEGGISIPYPHTVEIHKQA